MGHSTIFVTDEVKEKLKKLREKYRFRSFTETLEAMMKVWSDAEKRLGYGGLMEFLSGQEVKEETTEIKRNSDSKKRIRI